MKSAVVTGANGFVGKAVISELLAQGVSVYAVGRQPEPAVTHSNLSYIQCDIADIRDASGLIQSSPDAFFAFAWNGSAGASRADYALQLENAKNTADCVRFAKDIGCARFIGAGSITETETRLAVLEQSNKPAMPYIYGAGKTAAHEIGKCVAADAGIDFLWPYITNAYGPGELSPRLLNTTIRKMFSGEKLEFTAATQLYDFTYIDDVAKAFCLIAEHGRPFCEYTIGSGNARPLRHFLEEMRDAVAPDAVLDFGAMPFTGIDMPASAFDTEPLKKDTGFSPEVPFSEGVRRTASWIMETDQGSGSGRKDEH